MEDDSIRFSKKVDSSGRVVVPQEHREALGIDGENAIVEFEARVLTTLDDDNSDHTDDDRNEQLFEQLTEQADN